MFIVQHVLTYMWIMYDDTASLCNVLIDETSIELWMCNMVPMDNNKSIKFFIHVGSIAPYPSIFTTMAIPLIMSAYPLHPPMAIFGRIWFFNIIALCFEYCIYKAQKKC